MSISASAERVRFRDVKPYDAPSELSDLRGPRGGTIVLPHWVYWGPNPGINLDVRHEVIKAYQAAIQEGRTADQVKLLNRDLLIEIWPELMLPPRVRSLWENRFSELAATA